MRWSRGNRNRSRWWGCLAVSPGESVDPASFWRLSARGWHAIVEVPPDRWNVDDLYDPDATAPGKINSRWGGFLERVDEFDNRFFGISDVEALQMDPQHRMVMELAWEALEDAGLPPLKLRGTKVGVFIGISHSEYGATCPKICHWPTPTRWSGPRCAWRPTAFRSPSVFRGRAWPWTPRVHLRSSRFISRARAFATATAMAALVGGVNLLLSPIGSISLTKAGFCAGDGRLRAFDAAASGSVRAEGAGMVMLKPLSAALKNQDPIHAVIRGSAVNQSWSSNGLTGPSRAAQEQVMREAYARAKVSPGEIAFVETQGTGTRLGDVIEATALGNVLQQDRAPGSRCALGALKTNIGHMETASGIASLMKAALVLKHRQIPPNLNFENPNPDIPFDTIPLYVPRRLESWPDTGRPAFAGVNAFGYGGSNAHVVLEGPPAAAAETRPASDTGSRVLPLSARRIGAARPGR